MGSHGRLPFRAQKLVNSGLRETTSKHNNDLFQWIRKWAGVAEGHLNWTVNSWPGWNVKKKVYERLKQGQAVKGKPACRHENVIRKAATWMQIKLSGDMRPQGLLQVHQQQKWRRGKFFSHCWMGLVTLWWATQCLPFSVFTSKTCSLALQVSGPSSKVWEGKVLPMTKEDWIRV